MFSTKTTSIITSALLLFAIGAFTDATNAQPPQCDPASVLSYESCAKCHGNEVRVWKQTPHFKTFEQLSRDPKASEICSNLGLRSVKRSDVCINCHFTLQAKGDRNIPISGLSLIHI